MKIITTLFVISMLFFSFGGWSSEESNTPQHEQLILEAKKYVEENLPEYFEIDNITYEISHETKEQFIVSVVALTVFTEKFTIDSGKQEFRTTVAGQSAELYFDKETLKLAKEMYGQ